jgi:hypothetical protein
MQVLRHPINQDKIIEKKNDMNFKQHIIKDPNKVMIDYDLFSLCQTIPIATEPDGQGGGWLGSVQLPAVGTLEYLRVLKKSSKQIRLNPLARTISEYNFGENSLYILPTLGIIASPGFSFHMNSEIRKHMAEQIKKDKSL